MLSLQLRDMRMSSGVVYSSSSRTLTLLIMPAFSCFLFITPYEGTETSSLAWRQLKTLFTQWICFVSKTHWEHSVRARWAHLLSGQLGELVFSPLENRLCNNNMPQVCLALLTCSRNVLLQAEMAESFFAPERYVVLLPQTHSGKTICHLESGSTILIIIIRDSQAKVIKCEELKICCRHLKTSNNLISLVCNFLLFSYEIVLRALCTLLLIIRKYWRVNMTVSETVALF